MKKTTALLAALILAAATATGYAQSKSKGASEYSPGDQMKDAGGPKKGSKGASQYAPGHEMKKPGATTGRGASDLTPGDQMNDKRGR